MSVTRYTAQEIKTLELATRALIPLELLSPFPQLYASNADAHSRSSHPYRPLTDTEWAEQVTEYECAQGNPEHAARMGAPNVLSALHSLTWNCTSSAGESPLSALAEAARRAVVQSVAFECLSPGGWAVQLSEGAYVRRLPDGQDLSVRVQFLTSPDSGASYMGPDEEVNRLCVRWHGQVAVDRDIPRALERAWLIRDLIVARSEAELSGAKHSLERLRAAIR